MWGDTAGFPNGECDASPHLQCQDEVKSLTLAIFLEWLRNGFINKACPPVYAKPLPFTLRINSNLLFLQVRIAHLHHIVQIL